MSYVAPTPDFPGYTTPGQAWMDGPLQEFHRTHNPYDCVLQDVRGSEIRCSHVYGSDPSRWNEEARTYMAKRETRNAR